MNSDILEEYAHRGFLRDILNNNIKSVRDIWDLQRQLKIDTQPNTVMTVTIDNYHSRTRNKSEMQKQDLRLKILKCIEEIATKLSAMVINMDEDLYAVLLCLKSTEISLVEKAMELGEIVRNYIEEKTKVSVSVGIGNRYKNILDIHLSYKEALLASHHKFFLGKSQVIHIENIVPFSEGLELFSIEVETQLSVKVLSCDKKEAFKILDELLGGIPVGNPINPIIMKTRLIEIITTLVKVGLEAGAEQEKLAALSGYFVQEVLKSDTISDLRSQMRQVISGVIGEVYQGRKQMNLQIFEKAAEFINANFSKDITLEDVSNHIYISPYYFSRGFKKFTGMNFIEYLTNVRLREAKKLLLTTDLSIGQVGKSVGYNDPNYFGRVFKKAEGLPPSKFRISKKVHIERRFSEG
ncbi:MAG: helix-turn-helix domain-containing protein [Clostridium sp.]|mgnify:CR=1 FL=1|nr:helix-turn-helix domain-containing protein [Clostridium sp.]